MDLSDNNTTSSAIL
jgi:hypothetical protein